MARATGFEAQKEALGETATALVAVANAVADGHISVVPDVLVTGGGGSFEGLAAQLIRHFGANGDGRGNGRSQPAEVAPPVVEPTASVEVAGDADDGAMGGDRG